MENVKNIKCNVNSGCRLPQMKIQYEWPSVVPIGAKIYVNFKVQIFNSLSDSSFHCLICNFLRIEIDTLSSFNVSYFLLARHFHCSFEQLFMIRFQQVCFCLKTSFAKLVKLFYSNVFNKVAVNVFKARCFKTPF